MDIRVLLEMVQVPEDTFREIMGYVCSDLFSRILTILDTDDTDAADSAYTGYMRIVPKYKTKYGTFQIYDNYFQGDEISGEVSFNKKGIERRYYRNKKYPSKNISIELSIRLGRENSTGGMYNQISRTKGSITIYLPSQERIELIAMNPQMFDAFLEHVKGTVRHELMHATQDLVLGLDFGEDGYYDDKLNADGSVNAERMDMEVYYDDPIEFQPIILSEFKSLIGMIKVAQKSRDLSNDDLIKILKHFVDPTVPEPFGAKVTSKPYAYWFNTDKKKWKKAINLIYRLFQNRFKL